VFFVPNSVISFPRESWVVFPTEKRPFFFFFILPISPSRRNPWPLFFTWCGTAYRGHASLFLFVQAERQHSAWFFPFSSFPPFIGSRMRRLFFYAPRGRPPSFPPPPPSRLGVCHPFVSRLSDAIFSILRSYELLEVTPSFLPPFFLFFPLAREVPA